MPTSPRASLISSSLNGFTIASIFFISLHSSAFTSKPLGLGRSLAKPTGTRQFGLGRSSIDGAMLISAIGQRLKLPCSGWL
jgi:hypothetical protein